jgi:hypothetical protein
VRIVLGAVLIGFVSVYWWALISAPGAMLSGRQSVTEAATVALLRRIAMAEVTFQSATGRFGSMQELIDANLLAAGFEGPDPDYLYTVVVSSDDFVASAIPIGLNARYGFFIDGSGVAKYSTDPGLAPLGMAGAPVN